MCKLDSINYLLGEESSIFDIYIKTCDKKYDSIFLTGLMEKLKSGLKTTKKTLRGSNPMSPKLPTRQSGLKTKRETLRGSNPMSPKLVIRQNEKEHDLINVEDAFDFDYTDKVKEFEKEFKTDYSFNSNAEAFYGGISGSQARRLVNAEWLNYKKPEDWIKSSKEFLKSGGQIVSIIPKKYLIKKEFLSFRKYLKDEFKINAIVELPKNMFSDEEMSLIVLKNELINDDYDIFIAKIDYFDDIKNLKDKYKKFMKNQ